MQLSLTEEQLFEIGFVKKIQPEDDKNFETTTYVISNGSGGEMVCHNGRNGFIWYLRTKQVLMDHYLTLNIKSGDDDKKILYTLLESLGMKFNKLAT
jgi:hypothetical protein